MSSRVFDLHDGRALYECLGLTRDASEDDIKKAFRKLAVIHHPDKNPADGGEKFREMSFAYKILSNPEERKMYDDRRLRACLGPGGTNPEMDPTVELEGDRLKDFVNSLCREEEESRTRRKQFEDKKRAEAERRAKFDRENPNFKMPSAYAASSARRLSGIVGGASNPSPTPSVHSNPHSDFLRGYGSGSSPSVFPAGDGGAPSAGPRPSYISGGGGARHGSMSEKPSFATVSAAKREGRGGGVGTTADLGAAPPASNSNSNSASTTSAGPGITAGAPLAGSGRLRHGDRDRDRDRDREVTFDPTIGIGLSGQHDTSSHSSAGSRSAGTGRTSPLGNGSIFGNNSGTGDYGLWGGNPPVHKSTPPHTSAASTNPRRPRPSQHNYVSAPASFLVNGGRPDGKPPYEYDVGKLHKRTANFSYRSYVEGSTMGSGHDTLVDAILSDALQGYKKPTL